MKIGLLTYHFVYNFGAQLQTLSTYLYLKKNGHNPHIINFVSESLESAFKKVVPSTQALKHDEFVIKNFNLTKLCRNSEEIARCIEEEKIESVIIGSDAVIQHYPFITRLRISWSRKTLIKFKLLPIRYETNFPNPFWGEFVNFLRSKTKIKIAMMSVSCENTQYSTFSKKLRAEMHDCLKNLSYISVRDKRTRNLIKFVSKDQILPEITPDPVFSFNENVFTIPNKEYIFKKFNLTEKYILLSFNTKKIVNEKWINGFCEIAGKNNFHCFLLAMPEGIKLKNSNANKIDIPIDPIEWYCIIKYSSGYVGEKMHPIIVSLHNSIPFYCFDHYGIKKLFFINEKASKIYQLLEKAGYLEKRYSELMYKKNKIPSYERVFKHINDFDIEKCKEFSTNMKYEYDVFMKKLLMKLS